MSGDQVDVCLSIRDLLQTCLCLIVHPEKLTYINYTERADKTQIHKSAFCCFYIFL